MKAFILVHPPLGMHRVMPGVFTPAGVKGPGISLPYAGTLNRNNTLDHLVFETECTPLVSLKKSLSLYRNTLFDQKALRKPAVSI